MEPGAAAAGGGDALLFEQAACGLVLADGDGVIVRVNSTLCRWLGYEASELTGTRRVADLLTMGGRVFYQTHCLPLLQMQGSVAEVQFELLHRDRHRVPALINIARHRHDGVITDSYAVLVATDRRAYERELLIARRSAEASLAAREEAERKLQETNEALSLAHRRKDEFLATLAHELRNPLAPMRNVLEMFKLHGLQGVHGDAPPISRERAVQVLDRQLTQITHLVDDLMDVSRISQGRMELRRERVDLAVLAQAALDDARPMIAAAGHTLAVRMPAQALFVDADATRLTQVIANLLNNAAKYTPAGGQINLDIARDGEQAVITVRDTGIGIPREALTSVFHMFSQLEPALERSQGGLGIGLALVHGLVTLHDGAIAAHSEGEGRGSQFVVHLPLASVLTATGEADPALAGEALVPAQACRVLVIDDNQDAAETMQMALDLFGYEARTAHDGASGMALAASFQPTVILLDIGLPDMNGYEVARRIRLTAHGAGVFLVAATGWGQDADRQRAREAGFDSHLTKPIDFDQLHQLLRQGCGQG